MQQKLGTQVIYHKTFVLILIYLLSMALFSSPPLSNLSLCLWTPAIFRMPALWNISPVRISTWRGETGRFTNVLWSVGRSIPALMSLGVAEQKGHRACQVLPSWQFIILPRVRERMSCEESKIFKLQISPIMIDDVRLSSLLLWKQKSAALFDFDKQDVIDFTKISKQTSSGASEAWKINFFKIKHESFGNFWFQSNQLDNHLSSTKICDFV